LIQIYDFIAVIYSRENGSDENPTKVHAKGFQCAGLVLCVALGMNSYKRIKHVAEYPNICLRGILKE
jgi:hypothetical protein